MRLHGSADDGVEFDSSGVAGKGCGRGVGVTATTVSTWNNKPGGKRALKAKP